MYKLNINLKSIDFAKGMIPKLDKINISVSSFPNMSTDSYTLDVKDMKNIDHVFSVKVTNETQKIIIIFEKKNFIQNYNTIASTFIDSEDIPRKLNDLSNVDFKSVNIFEPFSYGKIGKYSMSANRKILGKLTIQLSLQDPYLTSKLSLNRLINKTTHNGQKYSKIDDKRNNEIIIFSDEDSSLY